MYCICVCHTVCLVFQTEAAGPGGVGKSPTPPAKVERVPSLEGAMEAHSQQVAILPPQPGPTEETAAVEESPHPLPPPPAAGSPPHTEHPALVPSLTHPHSTGGVTRGEGSPGSHGSEDDRQEDEEEEDEDDREGEKEPTTGSVTPYLHYLLVWWCCCNYYFLIWSCILPTFLTIVLCV